MTSLKDNFNGIQEYANDQGLDLGWIDRQGEWGVKASAAGAKGLTLNDTPDRKLRRPAGRVRQHDRQAERRGVQAQRLPHRRLPGPHQVGHLAHQRLDALRRGAPATVELCHRHPVASNQTSARRHRASAVPACDVPDGGRVRRSRHTRSLGRQHHAGLLRATHVPHYANHGRVPPSGRVPQARACKRWRPDAAPGHQRDHQRCRGQHRPVQGLHRNVLSTSHFRARARCSPSSAWAS